MSAARAIASDVGRVVASPYKDAGGRLGIQFGADGLHNAIFEIVYLWSGSGNAVSRCGRVAPFTEFAAARRWLDANYATLLRAA